MPKPNGPKGDAATELRKKKFRALRTLKMPEDALPGSLSLTHTKCGKPQCHCAEGQGHPGWQLTFMVEGKKRVERIPAEWAEEVGRRVEAGRGFREVVGEILTANAELLVLERKQRARKRKKKK
ncbi:MAG: DUF6788 family protein [Gemmatimonadota bacterium]